MKYIKNIIFWLGVILLATVVVINVVFITKLDSAEHANIFYNSFGYIIGNVAFAALLFAVSEIINKLLYKTEDDKRKKIRKIIFFICIITYVIFNIVWAITVRPPIVGDQVHACNLAQTFYRGNTEEFFPDLTYAGIPLSQYMEAYHQQISLSFVFSLVFRIIHFDGIAVLRVPNVISNFLIVLALYKICKLISKDYEEKFNKTRLFLIILTFLPLAMLSTFIYGDTPSLMLCLFSIYNIMKFRKTKQAKYVIYAAVLMLFAYMMRMNSLIFIIATTMYLIYNVFDQIFKKNWEENLMNIVVIAIYLIISIVPTSIVQQYYINKYNMNNSNEYPIISYFYMAMEESWRGKGWYNEEIGEYALKNPQKAKEEYQDKIKNRLEYFANNPKDTFNFYKEKLASMWAENTYSSIRSNLSQENKLIKKVDEPLRFYQKALLILICACSIVFLIKNRKNISLEILFLLTIFIGGFLFHIIWEAKSRYIIPYIVVLIPIASMYIGNYTKIKEKIDNKLKKYKESHKILTIEKK